MVTHFLMSASSLMMSSVEILLLSWRYRGENLPSMSRLPWASLNTCLETQYTRLQRRPRAKSQTFSFTIKVSGIHQAENAGSWLKMQMQCRFIHFQFEAVRLLKCLLHCVSINKNWLRILADSKSRVAAASLLHRVHYGTVLRVGHMSPTHNHCSYVEGDLKPAFICSACKTWTIIQLV